LHLIKSVGGRRRAAEVDRVWEVPPSIFAPPITYVLSCKWGVVTKHHIDDFLEVLRWSKEFGVDTPWMTPLYVAEMLMFFILGAERSDYSKSKPSAALLAVLILIGG